MGSVQAQPTALVSGSVMLNQRIKSYSQFFFFFLLLSKHTTILPTKILKPVDYLNIKVVYSN